MRKLLLTVLLLLPILAQGQASSHTAFRIRFGAALPATCSPNTGDVFFKTAATIGAYQCLVANTFSPMGAAAAFPDLADVAATSLTSSVVFLAPSVRVGTNPGQTANTLNLPNNSLICWRNAANNADVCPIRVNASDLFTVQNVTFTGTQLNLSLANTNLNFTGGKGQHITTQAAASDIAGTATFSGTTVTVTFTTAYTSAPSCVATDQTAAAPVRSAPTTSNVVFTGGTGAGATDVIAYHCLGNPT